MKNNYVVEDRGHGIEYIVFRGTRTECEMFAFQKNLIAMAQWEGESNESDLLNGNRKPFKYIVEKIYSL